MRRRIRRELMTAALLVMALASVVMAKLAAVLQASERDDEKGDGAP